MDRARARKSFGSKRGLLLAGYCLLGALVLLAWSGGPLAECQEQITVESRGPKQSPNSENELSDTLKYLEKLEKLDQYWSEVARPRFGRSEFKQPLLGFRVQQQPQQQQQRPAQRFRALGRPHYEPRVGTGSGSLFDLINAKMAAKYNSNDAY